MGLIDSIIGVESGGNPNARNPNSSASGLFGANAAPLPPVDVGNKFRTNVLVGELLFASRPSAVFRRVIAASVREAINGMIGAWSRAHICEKVFKAIPALANFNALRPIVLVRSVARKSAATSHAVPDLIFGRSPASSFDPHRHAVSFGASPGTSATVGVPGSKVGNSDNPLFAAFADAKHTTYNGAAVLSGLWLGLCNRGEFSELHSDAIYGGCH